MEDAGVAGTVQLGGLNDLVGDRADGLAEQEDAEAGDQAGHDERTVGVEPAELHHHLVLGDDRDGPRQHHRAEYRAEQHVAAAEVHLGEDVAEHGADVDDEHRLDRGDEYRVGEQPEEVEGLLDVGVSCRGVVGAGKMPPVILTISLFGANDETNIQMNGTIVTSESATNSRMVTAMEIAFLVLLDMSRLRIVA